MRSLTSFFFLATLVCCTFERVKWNVAGSVSLGEILSACFIVCYLVLLRPRVPRTTATLVGFFAAFLLVYLTGYFNLATTQSLDQFVKGLVTTVHHWAFLILGATWLSRRGRRYYWRAFGWFVAGMAANSLYGIADLLVARSGGNLDAYVLTPITGGADTINVYGRVDGASVFRTTAMSGDPNHLAIFLVVPILVLAPVYLRLEREHPRKRRLGALLAFLLVVEISTLSRSGLLGLAAGSLVLAVPYRDYLRSPAFLGPLAAALAVMAVVVASRLHYFEVVFSTRIETNGGSENAHLRVYSFIPAVLHMHPLLGLGLNNFAVYYQQVTGDPNWGPHSFYVALLVETGLVGTALFAVYIRWVFARLRVARALGRALTEAGDPLARRGRPLAWGMTAALVGTLAANTFYLTMTFLYFYALLAFAVTVPTALARTAEERLGTQAAAA